MGQNVKKNGLSFIKNRQRRNEGTFCASELAGIEPTPPAPKGEEYVRLDHSATVTRVANHGTKRYIFLKKRVTAASIHMEPTPTHPTAPGGLGRGCGGPGGSRPASRGLEACGEPAGAV